MLFKFDWFVNHKIFANIVEVDWIYNTNQLVQEHNNILTFLVNLFLSKNLQKLVFKRNSYKRKHYNNYIEWNPNCNFFLFMKFPHYLNGISTLSLSKKQLDFLNIFNKKYRFWYQLINNFFNYLLFF